MNPFNKTRDDDDWVNVVDSHLICDFCLEDVTSGRYSSSRKRLTFVCSEGHLNSLEMDLD